MKFPLIAALSIGLVLTVSASVAIASSSVVHDVKGDALSATESANKVAPGTPDDVARPYLDIKQVKVTKQNGTGRYVFSMTLGGPVPQDFSNEVCYGRVGQAGDTTTILVNPPDPSACFFAWNWELYEEGDLDDPSPIAPTVRWINGAFQGIAFRKDSGPYLFDTFKVSGSHITAILDAAVIDATMTDLSDGFRFAGVARNYRVDLGGNPFVGVADFTEFGVWSD